VAVVSSHENDHAHRHRHVHIDEHDWRDFAAQTELEGEVLLAYVTGTVGWVTELRGPDAPPVRRVLDIGCGPGVGTCELARLFPDAHVLAVDSSPAMLERVGRRAALHGLDARISTHLAELPDGLDGLDRVDMIWASMSLHHVGDEVAALRVLRDLLDATGVVAIAERAGPMRVLPDNLDLGRAGLADRLDDAGAKWFAAMREGLSDTRPSTDLSSMLTAAGLDVVGSRLVRERLDAPLSQDARRMVAGHLGRTRSQLGDDLDDDDLRTLDVLIDPDDPRGVMRRPDVFVASSRQIVIARDSAVTP
jgi:SAM-dependent methyltransferase